MHVCCTADPKYAALSWHMRSIIHRRYSEQHQQNATLSTSKLEVLPNLDRPSRMLDTALIVLPIDSI